MVCCSVRHNKFMLKPFLVISKRHALYNKLCMFAMIKEAKMHLMFPV